MNGFLKKHIQNVSRSIQSVDESKIKEITEQILNCKGMLYFTGIGKNGHVAATAASTYASIGVRSIFINPVDAVHGDMGNIRKEDIIFSVSKSGNTEELINFLLKVKEKNVKIISLCSDEKSKCQDISNMTIIVPDIQEADDYNIVPTVSIASYIILLQSIGLEIATRKNFNLQIFKKNHPGGNIGKLLHDLS